MVPVVSFVGNSGVGKTTFLEKLIRVLKTRGYRVAAIKHDAHKFEIDYPGKDSWRLTQAGSDITIISSCDKLALIERPETERENEPDEGQDQSEDCESLRSPTAVETACSGLCLQNVLRGGPVPQQEPKSERGHQGCYEAR